MHLWSHGVMDSTSPSIKQKHIEDTRVDAANAGHGCFAAASQCRKCEPFARNKHEDMASTPGYAKGVYAIYIYVC